MADLITITFRCPLCGATYAHDQAYKHWAKEHSEEKA